MHVSGGSFFRFRDVMLTDSGGKVDRPWLAAAGIPARSGARHGPWCGPP